MTKFNLSRRADIMFKLDFPEDVQGGLNIALTKLEWRDEASKIVVHIADAPGHGIDLCTEDDFFPDGSPEGFLLEKQMREFAAREICY